MNHKVVKESMIKKSLTKIILQSKIIHSTTATVEMTHKGRFFV